LYACSIVGFDIRARDIIDRGLATSGLTELNSLKKIHELVYKSKGDNDIIICLQELDFLNEGRNCEKTMENFKKLSPKLAPQISVPHIYWEYSTQRILAMEFMDGVGVTDVQAIKALGLRPADVARLVYFNSRIHTLKCVSWFCTA
jgi:hypothetical protein